jgi:hypothetical protein
VFLAWQTAAFAGSAVFGKLPEWQSVLMRIRGANGNQSFDDMRAQLETLSRVTGFPLQQVQGTA